MVAHKASGGSNAGLLGFIPDAGLFRIQPWRAMTALAADWCLIAAAFASAILWPYPITYLAAAVIVARTQLALAVVMHESAHGTLLPSQWLNDAVGQACAAGPLCLSLKTYRAGHVQHHLLPMRSDDPVAVVFDIIDYPISRRRLVFRLLGAVLGIAYLVSAFKFMRGDYRGIMPGVPKSRSAKVWEVGTMLTSNGLLLAVLALCGHAWLYLALWTLPSVTLLPLFGRIRAIMEHAGLTEGDDQSRNARTIIRPSWQTFLFGPHAIHYHIEHHLFVRMPFYNLGKVHQRLRADGLLPPANLYAGYGGVLRDVSLPDSK
ncbi:fatty acid desaturase family protein [Massilia sp. S19_KUP03_FR1]|uniref:fatty acid desaturase family protein n=1 Tax=Massilia sp. S19_KUP03_FR1 TaxID=3025503 RepID=UPI002FCD7BED